MKLLTLLFTVFAALVTVSIGFTHNSASASARHTRLTQRAHSNHTQVIKRCSKRNNAAHHPVTKHTAHTSTHSNEINTGTLGVINTVSTPRCGSNGATVQTTQLSGPNGNINWLNCGIGKGTGWVPPFVRIQDLVSKDLKSALDDPKSPFKACSAYVDKFETYGHRFNIPPILLAAFGMQESTCNRNAVGSGGEQGIMQISKDKCHGAPGGDCKDPDFNIRTAAKFFSELLKDNGGNVLLAVGSYNGWYKGMTFEQATAAAKSACCRCQMNLDYIHRFVNAWLQNINADDHRPAIGKYFNLNICL